MFGKIVLTLSALGLATAQIPSLGFCPDYVPMTNFDMDRFLGVWYEAERYFQLSEVVSRCVMANYTKGPEGKFRVSNEVTNRFTGIKRILEGEIKPAASKAEEGKLHVKYTTIPLAPETQYSVLETDYDNYAVLWSCSGIGPFHTQNAWLMTRERLAPGSVLQKAYGVLDKYKISKTFFVKTDQADCAFLGGPTIAPAKPAEKPETQETPSASAQENRGSYRSPLVSGAVINTNAEAIAYEESLVPDVPPVEVLQTVETVPERILKIADSSKEEQIPVQIEKETDNPKEEKIVDASKNV